MLPDRYRGLTSFHNSIEPFLQVIKNIGSHNPEALPQRSNFNNRDNEYENRITNAELYAQRKDYFVQSELCLNADSEYSGLYFFFVRDNENYPFFYLGKADNLYERLTKHFLTFDPFFYASAFPHNHDRYYSDCIRIYAEGVYPKLRKRYERQFAAFKITPFKEIGWISDPRLKDAELLKLVESNAIFLYKPQANGTKGSMKGNRNSAEIFEDVKSIIAGWLPSSSTS